MDERFETFTENDDEWFSDIELRALELEQEISEWRESRARELTESARRERERERELAESAYPREGEREGAEPGFHRGPAHPARPPSAGARSRHVAGPAWPAGGGGDRRPAGDRTQVLIDRGRRTARRPRSRRGRTAVLVAAGVLAAVIAAVAALSGKGPSWPPSVAVMQGEIAAACQNPDIASEPGQVNFACGTDTSQILWVFALMTSGGNPRYSDARTGRKGLEPITPAQGGAIAWPLNLHHPYDPLSPADSLQVAARAINNIIGGAALTAASGSPAVQPGLESSPPNCARYTGSPAIITRAGFPGRCASPVTSPQGRAALVADVYRQWMTGATPVAAQDASVLFADAGRPGDPQVQAILKTLPAAG